MRACQELAVDVGTAAACRSLEVPRATFYRRLRRLEPSEVEVKVRRKPTRALSESERDQVLAISA